LDAIWRWGFGRGCAPSPEKKFHAKKCGVLCVFYCEKLYLWPETRTRGSFIDPVGAEHVKRTRVENLAVGSFNPSTAVNSALL